MLKSWKSTTESREQLFLELCRALLDVLVFYGNTASTFFHSHREREEWRATFGVFVEGVDRAIHDVDEAPRMSAMVKKHVLVVDDSPTGRQAATNLLQKRGYHGHHRGRRRGRAREDRRRRSRRWSCSTSCCRR